MSETFTSDWNKLNTWYVEREARAHTHLHFLKWNIDLTRSITIYWAIFKTEKSNPFTFSIKVEICTEDSHLQMSSTADINLRLNGHGIWSVDHIPATRQNDDLTNDIFY